MLKLAIGVAALLTTLLITIVPLLAIIALIVVYIIHTSMENKRKRNLPTKTIAAKIIEKRNDVSGSQYGVITQNFISFEGSDGSRFELLDSSKISGTILVNDHGYVTFRSNELVRFRRSR